MARYRFGVGEYKYFAAPLPEPVATLREGLYPRLAPIANRWMERLGARERYPATLDGLARLCARHGQTKPTPLLLHYTAGGYNCLHQDLYGAVAFPLQATVLLSDPTADFTGRRVPPGGAAPPRAVRRPRGAAAPGGGGALRHAPPSRAGRPRLVSRPAPPRGERGPVGRALHARRHLPRRGVSAGRAVTPCSRARRRRTSASPTER